MGNPAAILLLTKLYLRGKAQGILVTKLDLDD